MATFILVHGGWGGAFAWDEVAPLLRARGHEVHAVDQLTSAGEDPAALGDLASDAAQVRALIDEVGGPVVVAGHSSGGVVLTEIADHPSIQHSIYLAAFWPPPGESVLGLAEQGPPADWFFPRADGAVQVVEDADVVHRALAADVDRDRFVTVLNQFVLQSGAMLTAPTTAPPRNHRTTYIVCTQDAAVPPQAQEAMAQQADRVERLDSSHCPIWSMPDRVADLFDAAARDR
jgi:pimeloyl-ACP methyl ester carboxylesterase